MADVWSRHESVLVDEVKQAPFYAYSDVGDTWYNEQDKKAYHGDFAPVWRWREAMYNDFKCRMDWCTQAYDKANHHPRAAFFNDEGDEIIYIHANPGERIELDASLSSDPDKDELEFLWWIYSEAGTYAGDIYIEQASNALTLLNVPTGAARKEIHLILEIKDKNPIASLFDYRRIVITVNQ